MAGGSLMTATQALVLFNLFWAVVQIVFALPFLRPHHGKDSSPFGFHPFKSVGTLEAREKIYRFGALWLIYTSIPQIPLNIFCWFLPPSLELGSFLFTYPFVVFGFVLLVTAWYVVRLRRRAARVATMIPTPVTGDSSLTQ
jgi:hypothetical protein